MRGDDSAHPAVRFHLMRHSRLILPVKTYLEYVSGAVSRYFERGHLLGRETIRIVSLPVYTVNHL